ncbi:MAG: DUF4249 domain-containing protein [Bacteroidota bacterium]|nr:DUF4249 domain-containing protein [Bacteroidota bacterium]
MKQVFSKGGLFILLISFYACTKVISVNLNDAAPQIVVEGIITDEPGPYQVQISKTVNFSASNIFPPVTGATVRITDNIGAVTDLLTETSPGIYTTHIIHGIPGHTYRLDINTGSQTYTATSTMPLPVALDSITFQHTARVSKVEIRTVPNFQDPRNIKNYYSFTQTVNGRRLKNTFVFDDRLSDGRYINVALRTDSSYLNIGDTVLLKMNCIDKAAYDYFFSFEQISGNNNFQSASPSNPVSNLSNNALGYFAAYTTQSKIAIAR